MRQPGFALLLAGILFFSLVPGGHAAGPNNGGAVTATTATTTSSSAPGSVILSLSKDFARQVLAVFLAPYVSTSVRFSSSTLQSIPGHFSIIGQAQAFLDGINAWFQRMLGIDMYALVTRLLGFGIFIARMLVDFLLEVLPKIRQFLAL